MKQIVRNALLVVGSLALAFGLAEAALWVIAPPPRLDPFSIPLFVNTEWGMGLKPGAAGYTDNRIEYRRKRFRIDHEGRRITPSADRVRDPARTIHVIGDSQTFGQGLTDDETWPEALQRALLAAGRADARVVNLGIPGINVDQYHARLRAILPQARPGDLVVVGLTWNDLVTPQSPAFVAQAVGGRLVQAPAGTPAAAPPPGTSWRLALFEATGLAVPRFRDAGQFVLDLSRNSALLSLIVPRLRTLYYRLRDDADAFRPLFESGVAARNFALLADMKGRAEARGLAFLVIFLPNRMFFDDRFYEPYSQGGRAFPARNYLAHVALPLCAEHAIRCVDTFDELHRHQREGMAYPVDGHYAPAGAARIGALAARAVAALLAGPAP